MCAVYIWSTHDHRMIYAIYTHIYMMSTWCPQIYMYGLSTFRSSDLSIYFKIMLHYVSIVCVVRCLRSSFIICVYVLCMFFTCSLQVAPTGQSSSRKHETANPRSMVCGVNLLIIGFVNKGSCSNIWMTFTWLAVAKLVLFMSCSVALLFLDVARCLYWWCWVLVFCKGVDLDVFALCLLLFYVVSPLVSIMSHTFVIC